jgi:hypothetical protein
MGLALTELVRPNAINTLFCSDQLVFNEPPLSQFSGFCQQVGYFDNVFSFSVALA